MRIFMLFLFLFGTLFGFSQKQKNDLYLFVEKNKNVEFITLKNDTLLFQQYKLWFNKFNQSSITLKIDETGHLLKMIGVKPSKVQSVIFNFTTNKNDDNKIVVKKEQIENFLFSNEIVDKISYENFIETLKHFKNIYIIDIYDQREISNENFTAKKIKIQN